MSRALAPVPALLASVALLVVANGLQAILLPLRAELEAFSTLDIGVLGSVYFAGFVAGCVLGPRAVRRAGHVRAFAALASAASAVALAHALAVEPLAWWPLRAVTGFCFAGLFVVIESRLNERATDETRGAILSVYTIVHLTVVAGGPLMVMLYDPAAFPLFALAAILVSLAVLPMALTAAPAPAPVPAVRLRPLRLYRRSPVGLLGCFAAGLAIGPFWALGPVFALGAGMDVAGLALFMSVAVLAGAAGQWPLGLASDRTDRRAVIALACALAALAGLGLALAARLWADALLYLALAFGATAFPIYAVCVAHANDLAAPEDFIETSSGLLLVSGIGSTLGPVAASAVMAAAGPAGLFAFTAAAHLVMAAFAVIGMHRRSGPPAEAKGRFVVVPRTAPTAFSLDARGAGAEALGAAGSDRAAG